MDSREAKLVLALYRPDATDPDDSRMAEALEQVNRDPELAEWFERQTAVNEAIRSRLKAIPVPADLKRRIIANHAARSRVIPFPKPVIVTLAAAAMAALMFFVWQTFKSESTNNFEHFRDRMAGMIQRGYAPMEFLSTNQTAIRAFFQTKDVSTNYVLPAAIESLRGQGGAVMPWENHKVCMLCLTNSSAGGELWVFITELANVPKAPAPGLKTDFKQVGNFMTASWTAGDKVYLITAAGNEATMSDYLH
jgi:hypothetical protein